MEGRGRLLVVQKTGWGKSFVYFIATKLLREAGSGPALLFSPLLSLMRNQIAAAERMGVRAVRITSDNPYEWAAAEERLAWLAEQIPLLPGHGIIYTLTVRDTNQVAEWLQSCEIDVEAYTGQTGERGEELEQSLLDNRVKALVATTASAKGGSRRRLRCSRSSPRRPLHGSGRNGS